MTDPTPSPQQAMQEATSSTVTTVVEATDEQDHEIPVLKLRLKKPKNDRKVQWTTETVDNEHMNKKKSKCCCVYTKPKTKFDDSSSEEDSDDECEHCKGHVEKKKMKTHEHSNEEPSEDNAPVCDL